MHSSILIDLEPRGYDSFLCVMDVDRINCEACPDRTCHRGPCWTAKTGQECPRPRTGCSAKDGWPPSNHLPGMPIELSKILPMVVLLYCKHCFLLTKNELFFFR